MYQRRNINIRRQMYRNFNKRDTNEDQMQEKHSVQREPDGYLSYPIPKTEKPKNDPGTQPGYRHKQRDETALTTKSKSDLLQTAKAKQ